VVTISTRLASVESTKAGGNQAELRMRISGGACARVGNNAQQIATSSRHWNPEPELGNSAFLPLGLRTLGVAVE
jgi:hypothetical protein